MTSEMQRQYNEEAVLLFVFFVSAKVRSGELGGTGMEAATFKRKPAGFSTWYRQ
jgi:hypothetical protein